MPPIPPADDDSVLWLIGVIALGVTIGPAILALCIGMVYLCCNMCYEIYQDWRQRRRRTAPNRDQRMDHRYTIRQPEEGWLTMEELTALIHTYENDPEMNNLPAATFSVAQPQTTSPRSMGTVTISRQGASTSR